MKNTIQSEVKTLRILYPLWVVLGVFTLIYVPSQLLKLGDVAQTLQNIQSNELLFRISIYTGAIERVVYIFAGLTLYALFESFNMNHYRTALLVFVVASIPVTLSGNIAQLILVNNLDRQDLAPILLGWIKNSEMVAYIFWGLWLFPLGSLAAGSGLFPKYVKTALWIAGVGYLLSFSVYTLSPGLSIALGVAEFMQMFELVFVVWVIFIGVRKDTLASLTRA